MSSRAGAAGSSQGLHKRSAPTSRTSQSGASFGQGTPRVCQHLVNQPAKLTAIEASAEAANLAQLRLDATRRNGSRSLAMQKVVGSSPIIRFEKAPLRGFFVWRSGNVCPRCVPRTGGGRVIR